MTWKRFDWRILLRIDELYLTWLDFIIFYLYCFDFTTNSKSLTASIFFSILLAKTVSRVLTQNASLHASYLTFLKQSGSARHLTMCFTLPNYIQDVYYFCTLARQIFFNSLVLTRVVVGTHSTSADKKSAGTRILLSV